MKGRRTYWYELATVLLSGKTSMNVEEQVWVVSRVHRIASTLREQQQLQTLLKD
jgi:hypothetical protein